MRSRQRQLHGLIAAFLVVIMGAAWLLLAPAQFGGLSTYVIVTGNSMEPLLHSGDLAILRTAPDYQVGDVVTYRHPKLGVVIHRIIGRDGDQYIFKGDHNSWVDSYRPLKEQLIGSLWLHLPSAGHVIGQLRSPLNMALLVFVMGMIVMTTTLGDQDRQRWLRRKHRIAQRPSQAGTAPRLQAPASDPRATLATLRARPSQRIDASKEHMLFGLAVLTFVSLLLALFAFTRPLTRMVSTDVIYTQAGQFNYTAAAPMGAYDGNQVQTGDPVFRKLVNIIDLTFTYRVASDQPRDLSGSYQLSAELGDSDGWRRTIQLVPTTAFTGDSLTASGRLDLSKVWELTTELEQQTAIDRHQYTLTIVPQVTLQGALAGQAVQDHFSPRLVFQLDQLELQLKRDGMDEADPLKPVQQGMIKQTHTEPNSFTLLGLSLPITTARWLPLIGVVLAVAGALLVGHRMAAATHHDEPGRIQFKYGPLLIDVAGNQIAAGDRVVEVASIDDLAKLAERDDRVVLHEQRGANHHYFVQDTGVTYHYQAAQRPSTLQAAYEAGS